MTGFLQRLAARSLGQSSGLQPRRASLFEGAAPLAEPMLEGSAPVGAAPSSPSEAPSTSAAPAAPRLEAERLEPRMIPMVRVSEPLSPMPSPILERHRERLEVRETPVWMQAAETSAPAPRALPTREERVVELRTQRDTVRTERHTRDVAAPMPVPSASVPRALPVAPPKPVRPTSPPPVQVTIGRVEIRAGAAQERRPRTAPAQEAGKGLEDYLRSRRGR